MNDYVELCLIVLGLLGWVRVMYLLGDLQKKEVELSNKTYDYDEFLRNALTDDKIYKIRIKCLQEQLESQKEFSATIQKQLLEVILGKQKSPD